jgi:2',3'-cyclic-nucleotide 2'-phosphodiesterase (5'-nucleotidase family)
MKKSAQKIRSIPLLLLLLPVTIAPRALSQQPAARTAVPTQTRTAGRVTETVIDASVPDDPQVNKMLASYGPKVRELEVVIGKLKGDLKKGNIGSGSLGNLVADGMRAQASLKTGKPVALALMNSGGMRRNTISEGVLKARDIFELLPFENALITVDLTGEQLIRLLQVIVVGREAQSGARITYKTKTDRSSEMEGAKLRDLNGEREVDPNATYTITTIDYLYRVGGRYGILQQGKNLKELGITLREAIMNYVKSETAAGRDIKPNLDGRFVFDKANSAVSEEVKPQ